MNELTAAEGMAVFHQIQEIEQLGRELSAEWKQTAGAERAAIVVELLEFQDEQYWRQEVMGRIVREICDGGVRFSEEQARRASRAMGQWIYGPPYKQVLRLMGGLELSPELRQELLGLRLAADRMRINNSEVLELQKRIDAFLGGKPPIGVSARGAWLKRVMADTSGNADWEAVVAYWGEMNGAVASRKWRDGIVERIGRVGREAYLQRAEEWLALGPTPDDKAVTVPEPDAGYQKGFVWSVGVDGEARMASHLGDFAVACYRKIPGVGAVSQKVGNASVQALAAMPGLVAVAQLSRLGGRVKYDVGRRLIEQSLNEAAERNGLSRDSLEAMSVPRMGLDAGGLRVEQGEGWEGRLMVSPEGGLIEWLQNGKPIKKAPAAGAELKKAKKELDGLLVAQRQRLEGMLLTRSVMSLEQLRQWYLEHPVVGVHARRLIWEVDRVPVVEWDGRLIDAAGMERRFEAAASVKLWHPAEWDVQTVLHWRCWLEDHPVRQPFKQAHREVYLLTDAERETATFSRRFAAHIVRQHPFAALCRERGWNFNLMGAFDSHNHAELPLPQWGLVAVLEMDFGNPGRLTAAGILLEARTGNLRFLRNGVAVPLEEVPKGVLTEVMRDVDLFVSVSSLGNDPNYGLQPTAEHADYWQSFSFGDLNESALGRRELLERLLPKLSIGKVSRIEGRFLHVQGKLHEYKIHLGSGNVLIAGNGRYLCIVQGAGETAGRVMLPFERDERLDLILSKAMLLAADDKIRDATIVRQLSA